MGNLKGFGIRKYTFRTYHHAGGARKAANTYRDDAEEARQYCASFSTNRKGGVATVPSVYDYVKIHKKWESKRKKRDLNQFVQTENFAKRQKNKEKKWK